MNIPKKIHYCWFGGKEKPESVKKYLETWKILSGYEIIEWNENNFNIEENDFTKFAYQNKKWAFVADYVRLKVLYEYGGIYLDTDIEVKKSFDELLDSPMILSFIYDCSIGTAVIGSTPRHKIIGDLLNLYNNSKFTFVNNKIQLIIPKYEGYQINNNNDLFTLYFIKNISKFKLVNKTQKLDNVTIYQKEYFERRTFNKNIDFAVHHCYGSWYKDNPDSRSKLARIINCFLGDILYDKLQCHLKRKKLPYYNIYLEHKRSNR